MLYPIELRTHTWHSPPLCRIALAANADNGILPHETEIKLSVSSAAAARRLLKTAGFVIHTKRHFERNTLLDTQPPTLKPTGQLLRLRQANRATILTYKGPSATNTKHKVREEIETTAGPPLATILNKLGYHRTFAYEKFRTEYARPGQKGLAVLDETPIGVYLELEGTPAWIDRTARQLGFAETDYILKSYGSLWAEYCAQRKLPSQDFIFPIGKGDQRRHPASK